MLLLPHARFYFPRRLGRPIQRPHRRDAPDQRDETYERWREGLERQDIHYESVAEETLRQELLYEAPVTAGGFTLITGEPGSGKSWLLEEVQSAWLRAAPTLCLGATVPILVRFRDLKPEDLAPREAGALADSLWQRRATPSPSTAANGTPFFERSSGRAWRPVWLLDGLDELPPDLLTEELCRRLAGLPGRVYLTCRTAIAQAQARVLQGCVAATGHLELLPLSVPEQRTFLEMSFGGDAQRAADLHGRLQANPQLRELAGSPLLLDLIAEVGETTLPAARAAFYGETVAELWARRVPTADRERLRPHRDAGLTALAAEMTLERVVAPVQHLDAALGTSGIAPSEHAPLIEALKACGVLRVARERVEFLHLTFQEYYLASYLQAKQPFAETLDALWDAPRYEETLALVIALAVGQGREEEVDRALSVFIADNLERHRREPEVLWQKGRSPLRLVIHLLARAAIKVETLGRTSACLDDLMIHGSQELRRALAIDRRSLPMILSRLAGDENWGVRAAVAGNASAPSEALARLAGDADREVRLGVAGNALAPLEVLARLSGDEDGRVRAGVAGNASAPLEVLARLAGDEASRVRTGMAWNARTLLEDLIRPA